MKAIHSSPTSTTELSELMIHSAAAPNLKDSMDIISSGRQILKHVLENTNEEPRLLPSEYVRYLCDNSQDTGYTVGKDPVLDIKFYVVASTQKMLESYSPHPNLQRLYGYCSLENKDTSLLILEFFPKGTVDTLLLNSKGCVQLNAQRRIHIMRDAAIVLHHSKRPVSVSPSRIGFTLDLSSKVFCATDDDDDELSLGIMMIELLTGALQNSKSERRKFGDFRERYKKGNVLIEDDLDPYVRESWTFNILSQLIELALGCIEVDPKKRPSTAKLVDTLTLISSRMQVVASHDIYM